MRRIGYKRYSPVQEFAPQLEGVVLDKVYVDTAGTNDPRPQREAMGKELKGGDRLIVQSMGIFGYADDVRNLLIHAAQLGFVVEFVDGGVVFDGANPEEAEKLGNMFDAAVALMTFLNSEDYRERFAKMKTLGVLRKSNKVSDEEIAEIRNKYLRGATVAALAREYKVSRPTIDKYLKEKPEQE